MDLGLNPAKDHQVNFIDFQDLQELRSEFLTALFASTTRYVYSKAEVQKRLRELADRAEETDAHILIHQDAVKTFRTKNIKGQFSELLLFNLLQHHFKAVPLVRKMKITTNPSLERNGADAIHVSISEEKVTLFLGEAKTYTSSFKAAFKSSLTSLIDSYNNYRSELNLYFYSEFVAPEVRQIAKSFVNGDLKSAEIHLVALISYERTKIDGKASREEILQQILEDVKKECSKISQEDYPHFGNLPVSRINYILLPFADLEKLVLAFQERF
ncbi:DUF1837 domain-containing protein [Bdellovibrio bacteriovorus]|uniref:HamA C-terminal domain-containing protein n=1 Tax=Bdellovibrio bacteriovorus TaxID=959 RepID=UPI0035A6A047